MGGNTTTTIHNTFLPQFEWGDLRMTHNCNIFFRIQCSSYLHLGSCFQTSFNKVSRSFGSLSTANMGGVTTAVTVEGGMKLYLPVESVKVKRCPVVDDTGEPIDFNKPGPSRVRVDSNSSGSSFEELLMNEFDDG